MAKGQMRSNKEARKPKKDKAPAAPAPAFGKQIKDLAEQGKKGGVKS
jgi:hypothetical protein